MLKHLGKEAKPHGSVSLLKARDLIFDFKRRDPHTLSIFPLQDVKPPKSCQSQAFAQGSVVLGWSLPARTRGLENRHHASLVAGKTTSRTIAMYSVILLITEIQRLKSLGCKWFNYFLKSSLKHFLLESSPWFVVNEVGAFESDVIESLMSRNQTEIYECY